MKLQLGLVTRILRSLKLQLGLGARSGEGQGSGLALGLQLGVALGLGLRLRLGLGLASSDSGGAAPGRCAAMAGRRGLVRVRVETWLGLVLVRFSRRR